MTPIGAWPAIGGGGRQPRKVLGWQAAIGVLLIVLLIVVKQAVAARETGGSNPLASLPGGQTVTAGLDIGGAPTDYDLQGLAGSYQVDGVVNLTGPDVAEQVAVASLQLGYIRQTISPGAAPTLTQLRALGGFMHSYAARGYYVYLHDDAGGGRAVAAAAMLLLLRGGSWPAIREDFSAGELMSLSPGQSRAIGQLASALRSPGRSRPGNPYSGAKLVPW
jgi:hypothetical protein